MLVGLLAAAVGVAGTWQSGPPLPTNRTEVAGASLRGEIVVAGGYVADGSSVADVDAYSPSSRRWRRLPRLPVAVNHAAAASYHGRLYVVGGYGAGGPRRSVYMLAGSRWRALRPLPAARAAAGAAVVRGRLYVVGGVVRPGVLARVAYVLDLAGGGWKSVPAPTPREHLAVTTDGRRIYAVAGRTGGIDTNLTSFESYVPGARSWRRLPPVPEARGGTGATFACGRVISVGGEAPPGTIASVYAFATATSRWTRLPDLPTPRHGLAVVAAARKVYVVGGGPQPGLRVSDANESLDVCS
jgi:non-specific serine/threonine protein kinase